MDIVANGNTHTSATHSSLACRATLGRKTVHCWLTLDNAAHTHRGTVTSPKLTVSAAATWRRKIGGPFGGK